MVTVYQCKRCGRFGHTAEIPTTSQRFEGTCNSCGQNGHGHFNCIRNRSVCRIFPHANVVSGVSWGGSGCMPWPQQQLQAQAQAQQQLQPQPQQQLMANGTMPWKQPQLQKQPPQQQFISYDQQYTAAASTATHLLRRWWWRMGWGGRKRRRWRICT